MTIDDRRHELDQGVGAQRAFRLTALEHCVDDFRSESFTDGISGAEVPEARALITGPKSEIEDPQALAAEETSVIPPETAAGKPIAGGAPRPMITRDLLFDIGADTVGLFVPGGSIAVKLAKAAIDQKKCAREPDLGPRRPRHPAAPSDPATDADGHVG